MKRMLVKWAAATLLVACLGFSMAVRADSPGGQNSSLAAVQVEITNFTFKPATITIPAGTTVTWVNKDDVPHTVVSTDGKGIKSAVLDTDDKFAHTFTQTGSYAYYCSVHPRMVGKVIVK